MESGDNLELGASAVIHPCLILSSILSASQASGLMWSLLRVDKALLASPPKQSPVQAQQGTPNQSSSLAADLFLLLGLITLKTRSVGSNMRAHTAKAWNCLPQKKFPPPSLPVCCLTRSSGGGGRRNVACTVYARRFQSHPSPDPILELALNLQLQVTKWRAALLGIGLRVGQCGLNPALRGWGLGCSPTVPHYVFLHCFLCKLS